LLANMKSSVLRSNEIRYTGGKSKELVDRTSVQLSSNLLDMISKRGADGHPLEFKNKRVLRPDAAQIMERIVGYGYSGAATKVHDAFRILRNAIEEGKLLTEDGASYIQTTFTDARIIREATLITAGGPNFSYPDANDPKCKFYLSESDRCISFVKGPFRDQSVTLIETDPRDLHGHNEASYVAAIIADVETGRKGGR